MRRTTERGQSGSKAMKAYQVITERDGETTKQPGEVSTMRPQITPEMILEAAKQLHGFEPDDAETISKYYYYGQDGYQLARQLDRRACWDLSMPEVQELDQLSSIVDHLLQVSERQWVADNNIQPTLLVGTRIKQGIITGVCPYAAARYQVKEDGETNPGHFLLVKFEDAEVVDDA